MSIKYIRYQNVKVVFFLVLLLFAGCEEEAEPVVDEEELEISDFTFFPEQPTMKDEISMLFTGCSYFQTTSTVVKNRTINVKKHFNSRLNRPCEMNNDTIPLGELKKGEYAVTLEIIDLNPLTADSVFHTQTKSLVVTNK